MNKYISFSGGVESTTMCLLFGNKAHAIWADTGWEHEEMYKRIDFVESVIQSIHPTFRLIRIKGKNLEQEIIRKKFFPSFMARYCTLYSKIEPIDNFLKDKGECELMIGLNADEIDLRTGNHGLCKNVNYSYPLADLGIVRYKCIEILEPFGLVPQFPAYMQRGGCKGCHYKSKKEYIAMALINEVEFDSVMDLEENVQDRRENYFSILPNLPLRELKRQAKSCLFQPDEMYKSYTFETNCGVFCHR